MGAKRPVEPPDPGEPGKYYFNPPSCISIKSMKAAQRSTNSRWAYPDSYDNDNNGAPPVNLTSLRHERTNCRLLSSRNGLAHHPPEEVKYLLGTHPTQEEISDYLAIKEVDGFGEGAIVTRRWQPQGNHQWPQQWGTVVLVHTKERGTIANWSPYSVKWHLIGEIEQAWAEDLIVIHQALDHDQLDAIAEAQGVIP